MNREGCPVVFFGELAVLAAEGGGLDVNAVAAFGQSGSQSGCEIGSTVDVGRERVTSDEHAKRCGRRGPVKVGRLASVGAIGHDV